MYSLALAARRELLFVDSGNRRWPTAVAENAGPTRIDRLRDVGAL